MGAWGAAIFSDDTTRDVLDKYKELLEDGIDGSDATHQICEQFAELINDKDEGHLFWLALAAAQSRYGRLEDDVKQRAIDIIDSGVGLEIWEEEGPKAIAARKKALDKLRDQLMSPQPKPKKVKKPWRYETDLLVGDAISYRLDSGKFVILRVIGIESNRYISEPIFELCDWIGDKIPSPRKIEQLPYIIQEDSMNDSDRIAVSPHKKDAYPSDRIQILAHGLNVRNVTKCYSYGSWVYMDLWLNHISGRLRNKQPLFNRPKNRLLELQ